MTTRLATLSLLVAFAGTACATPAPGYIGEWTPDADRTDISRITLGYERLDSNRYRASMDGQSFEFTTDGTEAETPWGGTTAVTALDSVTWQSVFRVDGQVMGTDTIMLGPDGQTLTMRSHRPAPDGSSALTEMTMRRRSGGPGLDGTWEGAEVSGQLMGDLTIADAGEDGLAISYAAMQATCTAAIGGPDAPIVSPMFEDGWSCAVARHEPDGLALTWKRDGEVRYTAVLTPSAADSTLTEVTTAEGTEEPVTVVYQRKGASE